MHNKTNLYRRIAGTFLALSVLIALAVFYFSFSWATVVIKPRAEVFNTTQVFALTDKDSHGPEEIKATIQSNTLDASGQFGTSKSTDVNGTLTGTVTLINTSNNPQPLRATTRLLSANDILFRMKEYASVPAKGQVIVEVYADKEGDVGQVDGSRFTIPGLFPGLQQQIYGQTFVQKEAALRQVKIVQQADIDKAEQALLARLQTKFRETLKTSMSGDINAYQAIDSSIISRTSSAKDGDQADQITVTITVRFVAVSFDRRSVYDRLVENMQAKLSTTQQLLAPDPGTLEYNVIMKGFELSQMQLRVSAQGKKIISQDTRLFDQQALAGKSQAEIIKYFSGFDDIDSVNVRLYPFWVIRAPALSDHINILLDTQ